jgi:hypothetical protein
MFFPSILYYDVARMTQWSDLSRKDNQYRSAAQSGGDAETQQSLGKDFR